MIGGFSKLHRQQFKNPLFKSEKFCRGFAWCWLYSKACAEATEFDVKGKTIRVERGQVCVSIQQMADAWNWTRPSVQRFLTRLKSDTMIETHTDTGRTIITICNYDVYQGAAGQPNTATDTPSDTRAIQQRYTKEEGKEGKEDIRAENRPSQNDLFSENPKPKPKRITANSFPDFITKEHAQALLDHRRAKKASVTPRWLKLVVGELEKIHRAGMDPNAAIDRAIERNWQGIKAKWVIGDARQINGTGPVISGEQRERLRRSRIILPSMKAHFEASGLSKEQYLRQVVGV